MKKIAILLALVLSLSVFLVACGNEKKVADAVDGAEKEITDAVDSVKEGVEDIIIDDVIIDETPVEVDASGNPIGEAAEGLDLKENLLPKLEVTAAILLRKAILPGDTFEVEVKITNNEDKPVGFIKGSGSAMLPQALIVNSTDMQHVPDKKDIGPQTMDFRTEVIEPGKSVTYTVTFMAIKPSDSFIDDLSKLLAEVPADAYEATDTKELLKDIPNQVNVEPNSYNIDFSFMYTPIDTAQDQGPIMEPAGYNLYTLPVTIG